MSTSILRRNSSKKNLQNLLRLTTQWSVEDEEEAARERRRRERQQQCQDGSEGQSPEDLNEDNCTQSDDHVMLKPAGPWETEEDEGFSDWSQRLEQRRQRGAAQATEETEDFRQMEKAQSVEAGVTEEDGRDVGPKAEEEEDEGTSRCEAAEVNDEADPCTHDDGSYEPCMLETLSISSNQWEARESNDSKEKRAPSPRIQDEEDEIQVQDRWRQEEILEPSTVQTVPASGRSQSVSGDEEEGITVKITERAEVLNRSIEKSNSIKRSEPPLPINKIDDRLEQYTHAIETSSKTGRLVRTPSLEMLSPDDAVSTKKNRWEAGDVSTASKPATCKDTEGINIGVSDMINQWGKEKSEPDGNAVPQKVTEVKPGEVLSKKGLWEQSPKSGQSNKSVTPNKKYKFVPTGHGKYEKILVEDP
ncbi:lymphocyte-specific protein 1 isoform X2 [Pseudophryne corroboree]|uniref:lymphocyte-specific protein 1 isoform X2 n=1 Tax=Pseudophryne corroboree TaxID=495146 RepID=UPI003081C9A4